MDQTKRLVSAVLTALLPAGTAMAASAPAPITPYAELRYRVEVVDQAGVPLDGIASTLRARIGLKSAEWNGLSGLVEGSAATRLGEARYNDSINGLTRYATVPDPTGARLNQALVRWRPVKGVELVAGRQAVNLDNQRWIGTVDWRQTNQTLDAARVTLRPDAALTLDYLHAWRVNRVFGPDSPQGVWHGTAIDAANISYRIPDFGTLTAYGYWLDIPSLVTSSSQTLGVRMAGERKLGKGTALLYTAEFARQRNFAGNPQVFSLDYLLIEPGLRAGGLTARAGWERLEGNGTVALQTPLATLHAFNGWADKFLTTPANGLRDLYLDAGYKLSAAGLLKGLTVRAVWHDYRSTRNALHYGQEWDALVSFPLRPQLTVSAKLARYLADRFATDTTKGWLSVELKL